MATKTSKEKPENIKLLEKWIDQYRAIESLLEDARCLFGSMAGSRLETVVWGVFDAYTGLVAGQVGDTSRAWLIWYLWDNQAGERGLKAKAFSWEKARPIKTVKDLYALIID